jgi:sec-independent protein translocase protein TatC
MNSWFNRVIGEIQGSMRKASPKKRLAQRQEVKAADNRRPFIEHVHELRRRLMYIAASVIVWSCAAYGVEHFIVEALLKPAHDQQFIYTSPGGGINFLFRVCLYVGIALSIPVIVYQILRYIEPLIKKGSTKFILISSAVSGVLAIIGMLYGYFWGLPAALDFLLHQFVTKQIQPLVTIQSYMSFVTVYMLGSAMLLQVPLLLICINRIKPIKPQSLFKYERHVIAAAFIIAGLMNPTPNVFALLFIAAPVIFMYQIGIAIIWYSNRHLAPRRRAQGVVQLIEKDVAIQAERFANARQSRQVLFAGTAGMSVPAFASAQSVPQVPQKVAVSPSIVPAPPSVSRPAARTSSERAVSHPVRRRIVM